MPEAATEVEPGNRAERRARTSDGRRVRPRGIRPRFISIKEACEYLNCSRSHFYEELYSRVRKRRLGKRVILEFDSVDELADSLPAVG
jgi:excisionase family DNA binding protein